MGLFSLIFRLGADNTDFNKGITQSVSSADRAASRMSAAFKRHLASAFSVGAISAAAKKTIDYASNIDDLSKASGIAAEQVQELDYAMRQNGATLEDGVKAARALAKARAEALAAPRGDKARLFAQFGINADELRGLDDSGKLLFRFSDAIKGTAVDANSLPAILELIGQKGQAAIPALVEGLSKLGQEARDAGLIMSNENVKALDELGDSFDRLSKGITVGLAPVLTWLIDQVQAFVDKWEQGVTAIMVMIDKLQTMSFKGKTPAQIADEIIGAGADAVVEAQTDQALKEMQRRADRNRKGKRVPIDEELEKRGADQKEIDRLHKQAFAKEQALRELKMTPEERRAGIEEDLAAAKAANVNKDKGWRDPLEQAQLDDLIAELELKLARLPQEQSQLLKPMQGDSLVSVGNFLGSNPAAEGNSTLKRLEMILQRIDRNTARTADNGIVLE